MNDSTNIEVIETAVAEYSPVAAGLADLRQRFSGVVWDLATVAGNKDARAARLELVRLRTSLEAKRKELKAPALERARLIDTEAKRITDEIVKVEAPIDQQIVADEERREAERQAKALAEQQRVAALHQRIGAIADVARRAVGKPSVDIEAKIRLVEALTIGDEFGELKALAEEGRINTLTQLRELLESMLAHEAEAARLAEQRREMQERLLMEQAAERERQRVLREAEEAREAEAARVAEEQRLERAAIAAEREAAAAERVRLLEERDALRAAQEKLQEDETRAAMERAGIPPLTEQETKALEVISNQFGADPLTVGVDQGSPGGDHIAIVTRQGDTIVGVEVVEQPFIKLGDLTKRLGFQLTAAFIEQKLGVTGTPTGKSICYTRTQVLDLLSTLAAHVHKVSEQMA